jgi:hypothetical protein
MPVSAVRPQPRRAVMARTTLAATTPTQRAWRWRWLLVAVAVVAAAVAAVVGGGGQPTPQAVRYGLSADEKKRRDEVLARAKRRKMTVDDSKGVAVSHSAGKQNSVENLSDQLGVHVVVSNFTKSDATDILDRLRRLSVVVDREVIARLTTHVVVYQPSRSVKFLCALAAGVWILSPSWVDASERAGFVIDPSAYEWSVATCERLGARRDGEERSAAVSRAGAESARVHHHRTGRVCRVDGVRARRREAAQVLESILLCGSAKVTEALGSGLTHVMLEQNAAELSDAATMRQLRSLSRSGVHVVSASFLQEYLTTFPRPSSNDPQFQVAALQQTTTRSSSMSKSHTSTLACK